MSTVNERRKTRKNNEATPTQVDTSEVKLRCKACKSFTNKVKFISTVGQVCPNCARDLGMLGNIIDTIESKRFDPTPEGRASLRSSARILQQLGLSYEITGETQLALEVAPSEDRRHLTVKNYRLTLEARAAETLQCLQHHPGKEEHSCTSTQAPRST